MSACKLSRNSQPKNLVVKQVVSQRCFANTLNYPCTLESTSLCFPRFAKHLWLTACSDYFRGLAGNCCKLSLRVALFLGMAILTACDSLHPKHIELICAKLAKKSHCIHRYEQCIKQCHNSPVGCRVVSTQHMAKRYVNYVSERCIMGKTVSRELKSYQDPLQCKKTTCDCETNYMDCMKYLD